jgi:GT2 family glycosyltransferase
MAAATLSIVIPTYNRADLLRKGLQSLTCHAPAGTEVIVVADGVPAPVVAEFPGMRLIQLPKRRGFCVAANAGIAAARGKVIELLNDDTEVTAGWAEAALACFADPQVAAVAPLVRNRLLRARLLSTAPATATIPAGSRASSGTASD